MLISYSKKFIFIHIYKTAGMSVRQAIGKYQLIPYFDSPNRVLNYIIYGINNYHLTATQLQEKLPKKLFNDYYKFAFVRNPWDWQVSLFNYMQQCNTHHQNSLANQLQSFEDYIEWRVNNEVRLQSDFLLGKEGEVIVDYIGHLETIDNDFSFLEKELNLSSIHIPKVNTTQRERYQSYYSSKTKDLVYKHFKKDIELFDYSF